MGYQSAYTKALLGIDVANEAIKERRELVKAKRDRKKEEGIKSLTGTILGIAGSAFGPIGNFVGKTIGTLGTDIVMNSEKSHVSKGKFDASVSDEINQELDDYDRDSNIANAMNVGISALTSFMMAGGPSGLKETLEGGGSVMDFATTFGAGETAKMSLYDWMGKSGAEKAASGLTDISYFEYLLGMEKDKAAGNLVPDWDKSGGYVG